MLPWCDRHSPHIIVAGVDAAANLNGGRSAAQRDAEASARDETGADRLARNEALRFQREIDDDGEKGPGGGLTATTI
jgi:hypothetical protein